MSRWTSTGATTQNAAVPTSSVVAVAPFTPGNVVVEQADNGAVQNSTATLVEVNSTAASTQSSPVQIIPLPGLNINAAPTVAQALRINGSGGTTGYLATTNDGTELVVVDPDALTSADLAQTTAASILNRTVVTFGASPAPAWHFRRTIPGRRGTSPAAGTSLDDTLWFVADKGGIYHHERRDAGHDSRLHDEHAEREELWRPCLWFFRDCARRDQHRLEWRGHRDPQQPDRPLDRGRHRLLLHLIGCEWGGLRCSAMSVLETTATAGTISKFSLVGGSWVSNGSYTTSFGGRSMVAAGNATGATLYLTGGDGGTTGTSVVKVTDTAPWNSAIAITTANNLNLYTFPASGPVAKGIAFAPLASATCRTYDHRGVRALTSSSSTSFSYTPDGLANSSAANAAGVDRQLHRHRRLDLKPMSRARTAVGGRLRARVQQRSGVIQRRGAQRRQLRYPDC